MSRRFAMLVSFLFITFTVLVSQPKLLWTTTKTNPDSTIQLSDAARDYSGNIYTVTVGGNKYGISLNKYSNTGTLIRETPLSNNITFKYWLAADKSGNAYVVTNDDQRKLTLTKYSPTGDSLWAKKLILSIPQEDYREGNSLIDIDGDGNVCIATSHEQLNGDGNFQAYLMMLSYSPNGDRRWMDTTISGLSAAPAEFGDIGIGQMKIDPFNNIYVSVSYKSRFDTTAYIAGSKVVKYAPASAGAMNPPQWIKNFSLNTISVHAAEMDIDDAGNIFMAYSHFISFAVGGRVRKYNSQGVLQWERMTSGGVKIAADNNGGVYVGAGKTISASSVIAIVFRFNGAESTYVGNFGSGNYSSIYNLSVDQGGYLAVSGIAKPQIFSTEGSYYFFEFTPSGTWNGYAMYASPGISQEYPSHLFKGNGSYIALGVSGYAKSKAVVWISKIQVAPTTPTDPGGNGNGQGIQTPYISVASGTTADLRSVYYINQTNGFIVGDSSTILRTLNSGISWTKVPSPVVSDFQKVKFYNADSGFIIGQGYILKTKDGGTTWNIVDDNLGVQTLYGIDWDTLGNMVAVGTSGTIHVSHNWGNTWQSDNYPTNASLRDVAYISKSYYSQSKDVFLAVGDQGIVIEGFEKGIAWSILEYPTILGQNHRSVVIKQKIVRIFGDAVNFYAQTETKSHVHNITLSPQLLTSVGKSNNPEHFVATGIEGSLIVYNDEYHNFKVYNVGSKISKAIVQNDNVITGVGEQGYIFQLRAPVYKIKTPKVDLKIAPLTLSDLILFQDDNSFTRMKRTSNAGITWTEFDSIKYYPISYQFDAHACWYVRDDKKTLQYSSDIAGIWQSKYLPDTSKRIQNVTLADNHALFVYAAPNEYQLSTGTLYRTFNEGVSWDTIPLPVETTQKYFIRSMASTNGQDLFLVIIPFYSDSAIIFTSNNSGKTWNSTFINQNISDEVNVTFHTFGNENVLLQVSDLYERWGDVFRTTDGGKNWKKENFITNQKNIFQARHSIMLTSEIDGHSVVSTDMGNTWVTDHTPPIFYTRGNLFLFNDTLYAASTFENKSEIYIHSVAKENTVEVSASVSFKSSTVHELSAIGSITDTLVAPDTLSHKSVKNVVVTIDSLLTNRSTSNIVVTLSHNTVVDTLFYKHEGISIVDCRFSDNAPFVLGDRRSANFSLNYNPHSPLNKFNSSSVKGKWILSVYSSNLQQNTTLKGWGLRIDMDQSTGVQRDGIIPSAFALSQNFPNPFNPTTTINYKLPMNSKVSLKIYDILGREVATLVNEVVNAGTYSTPFNSIRLASGVYFYRIEATPTDGSRNRFVDVKKMMYLK